jgi:hypothetical protein
MVRPKSTISGPKEVTQSTITIVVSYAWSKGAGSARSDKRWTQLRTLLQAVCAEVSSRASKIDPGCTINVSVARLRGRHGMEVLGTILDRIRRADVYVADIAGDSGKACNPNVMIELGMAIATDHGVHGSLFVLKPKDKKLPSPSNLRGVLWTEYERHGDTFKLVDNLGFRAALRSRLLQIGVEKGLINPSKAAFFEDDDDK